MIKKPEDMRLKIKELDGGKYKLLKFRKDDVTIELLKKKICKKLEMNESNCEGL
jgi:hypothetical protein